MDAQWEPEYVNEDEAWDDPEALPFGGFRRRPSPSSALPQRLFPTRRRPLPARRGPQTVAASPAAVVRELEDRQRSVANQLALLQQRSASQQSSEHFGPLATGAVGAFALGLKAGDTFTPLVTHGLPIAQLLLSSQGRAMSAGFRANPWSTLGFPVAAVLLTVFRNQIPGFRPTVVDRPQVAFALPDGQGGVMLSVNASAGALLKFTGPTTLPAVPNDPDSGSTPFPGFITVQAGQMVKIRAFLDGVGSEVLAVSAPPAVGAMADGAALSGSVPNSKPRP